MCLLANAPLRVVLPCDWWVDEIMTDSHRSHLLSPVSVHKHWLANYLDEADPLESSKENTDSEIALEVNNFTFMLNLHLRKKALLLLQYVVCYLLTHIVKVIGVIIHEKFNSPLSCPMHFSIFMDLQTVGLNFETRCLLRYISFLTMTQLLYFCICTPTQWIWN